MQTLGEIIPDILLLAAAKACTREATAANLKLLAEAVERKERAEQARREIVRGRST